MGTSADVGIACAFGGFAALLALVGGFALLTASGSLALVGFLLLVLALGEFFAVVGLWTGEPWARRTALALFGVHELYQFVGVISGNVGALFGLVVVAVVLALMYGADGSAAE